MQSITNRKDRQIFPAGNSGFTLLELMMAMLVFAVGILAVGAMQSTSSKASTTAKYVTQDLALASSMLERFAGLDYDSSELKSTDNDEWDGYTQQGNQLVLQEPDFTRVFGRYIVAWEVCEDYMPKNPGDPSLPAKRIAMTITWTGSSGQTRVRNFEFVKVKNN